MEHGINERKYSVSNKLKPFLMTIINRAYDTHHAMHKPFS